MSLQNSLFNVPSAINYSIATPKFAKEQKFRESHSVALATRLWTKINDRELDLLIKFRRAKCIETLDIMADGAERRGVDSDDVCTAYVIREYEINVGKNF